MRNIVIFGATGTIGAYLSLELKDANYNVIAVGKRNSDRGFFLNHNIIYHSVDITKSDDFIKLPEENIYAVIHCAGKMPAMMEGYHPQDYIDTIVTGTLNVLDYTRKIQAAKIIFTQSRADSNHLMNSNKSIPSDINRSFPKTGDHSVYTICKNAAVDLIDHYYYEYGVQRFILRLPTIYAYHPNKYFYVNGIKKEIAYRHIIERAKKGLSIEIWGNPEKAKEITYIKDLTQIIQKCIESDLDGGVYNVGRGTGVTLNEQINGIINIFSSQKKSEIQYRPDMPDSRQFIHDISKTINELGYSPEYNYNSLLLDFKKEMESQRFKILWGTEKDYD